MRVLRHGAALAALLLAGGVTAQQEKGKEWVDTTLADFKAFTPEIKSGLVRQLERQIQLDPNPAIQRIVSMQRGVGKLPVAVAPPCHRADEWAKGVAPAREILPPTDPRHAKVRARFPAQDPLPDLHKAVLYDWGRGMLVRRAAPLSDDELLENIYNGYPPGSDEALARLLQKFDNDERSRPMSFYLGHLYADLDAKAYAGVTLYDAWYSGEQIDVPDVDAIPFERRILKTSRFRSPIPAGAARTRLYQTIRDVAFTYRKYRTLREAAAAAFLRAEPAIDPTYAPLVPRFHYLYVVNADDVDGIEKLLRQVTERDELLRRIDAQIAKSPAEYDKRNARKKHLADMFAWLRYWAQVAVHEQKKREKGG